MESVRRRWKIEIYRDLLRAIHTARKNGRPVTMYRLETMARLPYNRVRGFVVQLQGVGLIDEKLHITPHGYRFLGDVSSKIAPVMKRYGLWDDGE
jgi:predicted transcriptional regulator